MQSPVLNQDSNDARRKPYHDGVRVVVNSPITPRRCSRSTIVRASASTSPTTSVNPDSDEEGGGPSLYLKKSRDALLEEAEALRSKAKEIMAEALAMEAALLEKTLKRRQDKLRETDAIIQALFAPIPSSSSSSTSTSLSSLEDDDEDHAKEPIPMPPAPSRVVADRLQTGRYSQQQVLSVVDRLFELQDFALGQQQQQQQQPKGNQRNVAPRAGSRTSPPPAAVDEAAYGRYQGMVEVLINAATLLDDQVAASTNLENEGLPAAGETGDYEGRGAASLDATTTGGRLEKAILSRAKELRQIQEANLNRRLAAEINQLVSPSMSEGGGASVDSNPTSKSYSASANRTAGAIADEMGSTIVPLWVPSTFLPYITALDESTVGPKEVETIKNHVLLGSRFYVTSTESIPGAAVFRGNIRTSLGGVPTSSTGKVAGNTNQNNNTAMVFADIQERLQKWDGLGDKVQLFIMPDLEERSPTNLRDSPEDYREPKPVILALSKALSPDESKLKKTWLSKTVKVSKGGKNGGAITLFAFITK
jgi:hypothetical protein